jgi:hypothetical protein
LPRNAKQFLLLINGLIQVANRFRFRTGTGHELCIVPSFQSPRIGQNAYDLNSDPGAYDSDLQPIEDGVGEITITVESQYERTHFSRPWRVETTESGHFVVKDATGFSICYVYARKDDALRSSYMTHAEALVIAEAIARLLNLVASRKAEGSASS